MPIRLSSEKEYPEGVSSSSQGTAETAKRNLGPSLRGVILTSTAMLACFIVAAVLTHGYWPVVATNGDNADYIDIIVLLRQWKFGSFHPKLFWGLPYLATALSLTLHLNATQAIAVISLSSLLISLYLVYRMWDGWVALYFLVGNYTLLQFSAFGGTEPLFLVLLLAGFWFSRQEKSAADSFMASLATTVRPLGVFALAGLGLDLIRRKKWFSLALAVVVSLIVLGLYEAVLAFQFGSPLANFRGYQSGDWKGGSPISFPFVGIVANLRNRANIAGLPMVCLKLGYVFLHVAALALLLGSPERRRRLWRFPNEAIFVGLYSCFCLVYSAPTWALSIYPRLLIPITPFLLGAFADYLPKDRRLIAVIGGVSMLLALVAGLGHPVPSGPVR